MHAALRSVLSEVVFTGHVVLQLYMVQLQVPRTQWVPSRYTWALYLLAVSGLLRALINDWAALQRTKLMLWLLVRHKAAPCR